MNRTEFDAVKKLIATPEPPQLGPKPRPHTESVAVLDRELGSLLRSSPAQTEAAIRSAVLLWHDHLDASHTVSQNISNADGSFLHGIMHRREPDYGNAKYWFRRVGKHGAFPELAKRVATFLKSKSELGLEAELLPHGEWDAVAFIDACEEASDRPSTDARYQLLRVIQAIEFEVLLEHICGMNEGLK